MITNREVEIQSRVLTTQECFEAHFWLVGEAGFDFEGHDSKAALNHLLETHQIIVTFPEDQRSKAAYFKLCWG